MVEEMGCLKGIQPGIYLSSLDKKTNILMHIFSFPFNILTAK